MGLKLEKIFVCEFVLFFLTIFFISFCALWIVWSVQPYTELYAAFYVLAIAEASLPASLRELKELAECMGPTQCWTCSENHVMLEQPPVTSNEDSKTVLDLAEHTEHRSRKKKRGGGYRH